MLSFSPRNACLAVLLVGIVSAGTAYYHLGVFLPYAQQLRAAKGLDGGYSFGNDIYPIWLTSREALLRHRNPYTPAMTRDIQIGLFGRPLDARNPMDPPGACRAFAYPAYADVLFWPLSLLPFTVVRVAIAAILTVLTAASVLLWLKATECHPSGPLVGCAMLLTLSSYAALEGLFAVQPGLLVAFLLSASFVALVSNRTFLAGSLFAFTFIKPQVALLVAVYLLVWTFSDWRRRRGFVVGFLAWSALLAGTSLFVWPRWIMQWLSVLSGYRDYTPPPLIVYSLGPKLGPKLGPILVVALLLTALMLIWKMRGVPSTSPLFLLAPSLLLALTCVTILPGHAVYDHIVLLPGILLAAFSRQASLSSNWRFRVVLGLGSLVLFWQWLIVVPLLILRWLPWSAHAAAGVSVMLPLRTAGSIPMAVTAVLGWMTANALRYRSVDHRAVPHVSPAELS